MRIKALTKFKTPVLNAAGSGTTISNIPENTMITITKLTKIGILTYYFIEEFNGYIKKDFVKLLRDEEFYYTNKLLRSKQNRSAISTFSVMTNSIQPRADKQPAIYDTTNQSGAAVKTTMPSSKDGLIKDPKTASEEAKAQSSNNYTRSIASTAANYISSQFGNTGYGYAASTVLSSFANTGSWDDVNNMNVGNFIGGDLGNALSGATINNISDGSFFSSAQFKQNMAKLAVSYMNTLLMKLNYVVGFNLSGILLNLLSGFGVLDHVPIGIEVGWDGNFRITLPNVSNIEERIRQYFRYKGANYEMITRYGYLQRWEQDAYYTTPSLTSHKNAAEVEVHRTIYNNLYSDFRDSLNAIRDTVNLNITRNDWFDNFNRYRLMHPDSVLGNTKGYVFFTRPDLNINNQIASTDIGLLFYNMATQHPGIVGELLKYTYPEHQFNTLLSNRCTGLDIQDENLKTKEIGETLTGWKLNYGINTNESKTANTVTTSFIDDEQLSVYLIFKLWCEYISAVSKGTVSPKDIYKRTKIIDYAIAIYYFLCAEDGESIVFWTKYTGCIPTVIPSSNFSDSIDSPIRMPKYSIQWQYAFKKDYDPFSLAEFNHLTGSNFSYTNIYNSETARSFQTIVGAPFVDTNTGGRLFKLRFRQKKYNY